MQVCAWWLLNCSFRSGLICSLTCRLGLRLSFWRWWGRLTDGQQGRPLEGLQMGRSCCMSWFIMMNWMQGPGLLQRWTGDQILGWVEVLRWWKQHWPWTIHKSTRWSVWRLPVGFIGYLRPWVSRSRAPMVSRHLRDSWPGL